MSLTDAVSQFIVENEIKDVGGMYPCVKIDQRGVGCLGMHHRFPLYEVSLTYDATRGRWIQENHTTGKRIELLRPWEVMSNLSAVVRNLTTCARRSSTLIRCVLVGSNLSSKQSPRQHLAAQPDPSNDPPISTNLHSGRRTVKSFGRMVRPRGSVLAQTTARGAP